MAPAITGKHGQNGAGTYIKEKKTIDKIFVTILIKVKAPGYLEHGKTAGDHCPIWVEIFKESVLDTRAPEIPSFCARKLKCHDPCIVLRYNKASEKYLRDHNFFTLSQKAV